MVTRVPDHAERTRHTHMMANQSSRRAKHGPAFDGQVLDPVTYTPTSKYQEVYTKATLYISRWLALLNNLFPRQVGQSTRSPPWHQVSGLVFQVLTGNMATRTTTHWVPG